MNVTIIGTGNMARGISTRLLAGGNGVALVGRAPGKAKELATQLQSTARGGAMVTAVDGGAFPGEIVVLAVPYPAIAPLVTQHAAQLAGKIVVDISNPIDFEALESIAAPGSSAAEELALSAPPGAKIVKAFNTTFAGALLAGHVSGQPLDVFIAGDDAEAKAAVAALAESAGLRPLDAGALRCARQLEAMGLLHIKLQFTLGTGFASSMKLLA
jgi:NADPH-dependent F420 reductase